MNENLNERFGRGKAIRDSHMPRALSARPLMTLNLSIREYAKTANQPTDQSHWTGLREIPSPSEVFDEGRKEHDTTLELTENTVVGPYVSKEEYLESHYRLLREDAVAPLRDVVSEIQLYPQLMEKDSDNGAYIYEKVRQNVAKVWIVRGQKSTNLKSCYLLLLSFFINLAPEQINTPMLTLFKQITTLTLTFPAKIINLILTFLEQSTTPNLTLPEQINNPC